MKKTRVSNFSSSKIHKLCSKGRGALSVENVGSSYHTYIKEKKRENRLKRAIENRVYTYPIIWGIILEMYIFEEKLDTSFSDMNNVGRCSHPDIPEWTGIPDTFRRNDLVVGDIKNPSSMTAFCDLVDCLENGVEYFKDNKPDYYWQLVSNAILTGVDKAELIFFVPKLNELKKIYDFINEKVDQNNIPSDMDVFQYEYILNEINAYLEFNKLPKKIPYLPDDTEYKDFNTFTFDVPEEDKIFLTERVKMAVKELKS